MHFLPENDGVIGDVNAVAVGIQGSEVLIQDDVIRRERFSGLVNRGVPDQLDLIGRSIPNFFVARGVDGLVFVRIRRRGMGG
jgi:hypothetical protein